MTVATDPAQLATLETLRHQGDEKGVPGLEIWDSERIRGAEPNLSEEVIAALYAPTTGVINPYEACFALAENACRNGLHLVTDARVLALSSADDTWTVHSTRGASTPAS